LLPFSLAPVPAEAKRPVAAQKNTTNPGSSPDIAEKQADLGELRSKIDEATQGIESASEENKADAGGPLCASPSARFPELQRELQRASPNSAPICKKTSATSNSSRRN
jgi:hypothetical protein